MKKIFAAASAATLAFAPVYAANALQVVPEEQAPEEAGEEAPTEDEAPSEQAPEAEPAEDTSAS